MRHLKYLDEIKDDSLRKDLIYACEGSLEEPIQEDDEETRDILMHEQMFNRLSIT